MAEDKSKFQDGGYSSRLKSTSPKNATEVNEYITKATSKGDNNYMRGVFHNANIPRVRKDIYKSGQNDASQPLFNKTWRFGLINPYGAMSTAREYIFFTKPELNIIERNDNNGQVGNNLSPGLQSAFWQDMFESKKRIIELLQCSYGKHTKDKFNHLLQNMVISNLEVPTLQAPTIETSTNMYGVGFSYRGSSEQSDDGPEFSLEFKDDKYLNVYSYFRAYEEYETEKHHGTVRPWLPFIEYKILHDQIAVYKFIVDEDMETILYYGKYYGVFPISLPRDTFSTDTFENGISYSINFKAAFYEDMRPEILDDFNVLSQKLFKSCKYYIKPFNDQMDSPDCRPAKAAMVIKDTESKTAKQHPNGYVYKLIWKGDDEA